MPRKEVQMFRAFTDVGTAPLLGRNHATLPRVCTPRSRGQGGMKGADISPSKAQTTAGDTSDAVGRDLLVSQHCAVGGGERAQR